MKQKYKAKITKAYLITIEDKDGYEVATDWSFLDYTETKREAEKLLRNYEYISYEVKDDDTEVKPHNKVPIRDSGV